MPKVLQATRMIRVDVKTQVGEKGDYQGFVISGRDNFTGIYVYKAIVAMKVFPNISENFPYSVSGVGGNFYYTTFEEASEESKNLLVKTVEREKAEIENIFSKFK